VVHGPINAGARWIENLCVGVPAKLKWTPLVLDSTDNGGNDSGQLIVSKFGSSAAAACRTPTARTVQAATAKQINTLRRAVIFVTEKLINQFSQRELPTNARLPSHQLLGN
jgi:hypothetical protein